MDNIEKRFSATDFKTPIFLFRENCSSCRTAWYEYYSISPNGGGHHEAQIIEYTEQFENPLVAKKMEASLFREFAQRHPGHKIIVLPIATANIPIHKNMWESILLYEKNHRALKIIPAYTMNKEDNLLTKQIHAAAMQAVSQHSGEIESDEPELY